MSTRFFLQHDRIELHLFPDRISRHLNDDVVFLFRKEKICLLELAVLVRKDNGMLYTLRVLMLHVYLKQMQREIVDHPEEQRCQS